MKKSFDKILVLIHIVILQYIYIFPGQNKKSGYFLKKDHSLECQQQFISITTKEINNELNKEEFIQLCENVINNSNIYDRRLFKEEFKKIYNDPKNKFKFPIYNTYLGNIITRWKNNIYKFCKSTIFYNQKDYNECLIFRGFSSIYIQNKKNDPINIEFIIWANEENF